MHHNIYGIQLLTTQGVNVSSLGVLVWDSDGCAHLYDKIIKEPKDKTNGTREKYATLGVRVISLIKS